VTTNPLALTSPGVQTGLGPLTSPVVERILGPEELEAMSRHIDVNRSRINTFRRKWQVRELALFGSVLRDDFTASSDSDVLVTFQGGAAWTLLEHPAMQEELSSLPGRRARHRIHRTGAGILRRMA